MLRTEKIVGAHFRPPAKSFIQGMPIGQLLVLRREPGNPYDPNAIQVLVTTEAVAESDLETIAQIASGQGFDLDALKAEPEWHLGFIPKEVAAELADEFDSHGLDVRGEFCYDAAGKPLVKFAPQETYGEDLGEELA